MCIRGDVLAFQGISTGWRQLLLILGKKVGIKSLLVKDKGSSSNFTKLFSLSDAKSIDFKYH